MRQAEPYLQTWWDWRAAANFMLGGAGAGLIAIAPIATWTGTDPAYYLLLGIVLIGAGLGFVWLEIGRRLRAMNVFRHPHMSWMTRESYAAVLVFISAIAQIWTGIATLTFVAAFAALGFVYCQAQILKAAKGIPAWREPRLIPFILLTGLAEGAVLLYLVSFGLALKKIPETNSILSDGALVFASLFFLVNLLRFAAWIVYFNHVKTNVPDAARLVLTRLDGIHRLFGFWIPTLLTAAAWGWIMLVANLWPQDPVSISTIPISLLATIGSMILVLATGWYAKFVLIARASYTQGFAIPKRPARGPRGSSGEGVKPGWS